VSKDAAPGPIRLALVIEDPVLADRLTALLAGVPGLRLVGATEAADAAVVPSTTVSLDVCSSELTDIDLSTCHNEIPPGWSIECRCSEARYRVMISIG
jgi:hypothetical protein